MDVFYLDLLTAAFPAETPSRGRAYIRQKLNNADKMLKRKAKVTEAGNWWNWTFIACIMMWQTVGLHSLVLVLLFMLHLIAFVCVLIKLSVFAMWLPRNI